MAKRRAGAGTAGKTSEGRGSQASRKAAGGGARGGGAVAGHGVAATKAPVESLWGRRFRDTPYEIQTTHSEGDWHFRRHRHRGYCELVCLHEGAFHQTINDEPVSHGPRTMIWIREQDAHELWGHGFVMTNLMMSNAWLRQLEQLWGGSGLAQRLFGPPMPPSVTLGPRAWRSFEQGLHRLHRPGPTEGRTALFARFILDTLLDHFVEPHALGGAGERLPGWLSETVGWIAAQGNRPVRVEDVVERSGRSAEHVARSFRRYLGRTPSRYLNQERLRRAAEMLRDTDAPVLEICFACGFDNPSYFHRLFREAFAQTPAAYRKAATPGHLPLP